MMSVPLGGGTMSSSLRSSEQSESRSSAGNKSAAVNCLFKSSSGLFKRGCKIFRGDGGPWALVLGGSVGMAVSVEADIALLLSEVPVEVLLLLVAVGTLLSAVAVGSFLLVVALKGLLKMDVLSPRFVLLLAGMVPPLASFSRDSNGLEYFGTRACGRVGAIVRLGMWV